MKNLPTKDNSLISIRCTDRNVQQSAFFEFENHLKRQQLSPRTIKEYLYYHEKMCEILTEFSLSQDIINVFLDLHNCTPARAYLKQLLSFHRNKEIEIPKIKGARARKKPNIMNDEEIVKVRSYLYDWNLKFGLMFEITEICGLRRSEIIGIRLTDFDWDNWKYQRDKPCKLKLPETITKRGRERNVPIPAIVMEGIVEYLKTEPQEEDQPLFKMNFSRWSRIFRRACLETLGKTYKLHEIRHTRTLKWYKEGKDLMQIKDRLGHSSIATTQLYINPSEEESFAIWEKELE